MEEYILILAILYDSQDRMVRFGDYYESKPDYLVGDQTLDFEICVEPPDHEVSRYELQAWGQ